MEEAVRWNSKVSREIDLTLRTYLGAQDMKKGDLEVYRGGRPLAHLQPPTQTSSKPSSIAPFAKSVRSAASKGRLTKPVALRSLDNWQILQMNFNWIVNRISPIVVFYLLPVLPLRSRILALTWAPLLA